MTYRLLPSVMCINWLNAVSDLDHVACSTDFFHWDIVDGNFAPDFTMGSSIISCIRSQYPHKGDFHLMVDEPARLFSTFNFQEGDRVCIHVECSRNIHRDLIKLRGLGVSTGVALSPATPLSTLEYVLPDIDRVLILTVNPGFHSQPLVTQALSKISRLRTFLREQSMERVSIVVDGNVNVHTIPEMHRNGAREYVLGKSGLFNGDIKQNLANIKKLLDKLEYSLD